MTILEKKVLSSDGIHELAGKVYLPDGCVKGYLHVVHGMTEHIGRYDNTLRYFAEQGYVTFAYDHVGHGQTARNDEELGFFADKNGWRILVNDVDVFASAVRKEYGDLPYTLLGHSMGSFIVRLAAREKRPDKLIVMGTGGPNPAAKAGKAVVSLLKLFGQAKKPSPMLEKMAFGMYNQRFQDENDKLAWLTKDRAIRAAYAKDKFCTFHFTVSALGDLITLNAACNEKSWFTGIPDDLPILLVSGAEDPVGDNGTGVKAVNENLLKAGKNVRMVLYENCRHEILNDTCRQQVLEKMKAFMEA